MFLLTFLMVFLASAVVQDPLAQCFPHLPEPHTNNAVASIELEGRTYVFSFAGLTKGKTWKDTSKSAYMLTVGNKAWTRLPDLPVKEGRLAASAQAAGGILYIFGGYTVAEDGSEKSTPEVFAFDPLLLNYRRKADMPTPVDDMVTFVYKDRYVYLVSGWHDDGNVSFVQIYDTENDKWMTGTDYPGTPVFGHAGGIVGNRFVIADGVAVVGKTEKGSRIFETINERWLGIIDENDPARITYLRLQKLDSGGHYRMAAAGDEKSGRILFAGGTETAYNYNGIGYNGTPASATNKVIGWDVKAGEWVLLEDRAKPSMDHRGLVRINDGWYTIGGFDAQRNVTADILGLADACSQLN